MKPTQLKQKRKKAMTEERERERGRERGGGVREGMRKERGTQVGKGSDSLP